MEKALTFKSASEEAAYYKAEIDKLFRAMDRNARERERLRVNSERLKVETDAILERLQKH